jgi:hypothetical protein
MNLNWSLIRKRGFPIGSISRTQIPKHSFYEPEPAIRKSGRIDQRRKQFIRIEDFSRAGGNSNGR